MPDRRHPGPAPADLLAAYEMGLLDEADRARFEAALLDDADLLDELYDGAADADAMRADPARYAAAVRAALQRAQSARRTPFRDRLRGWLQPRAMVPVIAAAALAAVILWPEGQEAGLARLVVLEPLPVVTVDLRAAAGSVEQQYEAALEAYADNDWQAAADALTATLAAAGANWPRGDQARLYLGSSLLLAGHAAQAVVPLVEAAASRLAPVRDQALWTLAQAHLQLGDAALARQNLMALKQSPVFGPRATDLLDRLAGED